MSSAAGQDVRRDRPYHHGGLRAQLIAAGLEVIANEGATNPQVQVVAAGDVEPAAALPAGTRTGSPGPMPWCWSGVVRPSPLAIDEWRAGSAPVFPQRWPPWRSRHAWPPQPYWGPDGVTLPPVRRDRRRAASALLGLDDLSRALPDLADGVSPRLANH